MTWQILQGDAIERLRDLEAGSIQTCVTSPPYWGLRDYGTASWEGGDSECDHKPVQGANAGRPGRSFLDQPPFKEGCGYCGAKRIDSQLGLEPTPEQYVENLVAVFREVRRVLRDDGTVWLNLGDSYAGSWGAQSRGGPPSESSTLRGNGHIGGGPKVKSLSAVQIEAHPKGQTHTGSIPPDSGLKPKDLCGIPWRVAFALQVDGWWLRSDIIWAKPNPMPESVTDRPTRAHEYIFLLSKSARYFYDADAIREESTGHGQGTKGVGDWNKLPDETTNDRGASTLHSIDPAGRNKRSVWEITTQPYPEAHFATFPPKLVEPCILAGSPPKCCGECGAPWERITETERPEPAALRPKDPRLYLGHSSKSTINQSNWHDDRNPKREVRTLGWRPTCDHRLSEGVGHREFKSQAPLAQSVVLDPFCGSGTTGLVALRHNRSFIGIELNPDYCEMARNRIRDDAPLFNIGIEA